MGVSISNEKIVKGWGSSLICHSSGLVRLDSSVLEGYPVRIHNWLFSTIIMTDSDLQYIREEITILVTVPVKEIHVEVL